MEYTNLGASGLQVSRPCLGTMMFGHSADAPTSEPGSRRIIDAYLETGGNFIDTVIIGPRTFEQYEQNMAGFDLVLDPALIKRLSDASRWAR